MSDSHEFSISPRPHRSIRSFVLRQGRQSPAQTRAIETLMPRFGVPFVSALLDFRSLFGREAQTILEIGFGMGEATAHIARHRPETNFLACEVHTPGVGSLLKLIGENTLENIRIVQHDAVDVLKTMIADDSLDGVHIFFPDPWPKKRHHKRRLVQPPLVNLIAHKLKPGGYIHLATDWEEYAQEMLVVLRGETRLENTADDFSPRPDYRPLTNFERKGIDKGHKVHDLLFRKATTRKP